PRSPSRSTIRCSCPSPSRRRRRCRTRACATTRSCRRRARTRRPWPTSCAAGSRPNDGHGGVLGAMNEQGLVDSAILLLALGEDAAAEVFRHLTPKEVQRLGETMSRTRTTSRERLQSVLERFQADAGDLSTLVDENDGYIRSVLRRALGEDKAGLLIERILQGGDVSGIESLKWMDPQSVAELIRNEHPQI